MPHSPPSEALDPDLEFILLAQAGDLDAFDTIVLRHQSLIAAVLHRFARNLTDLEDLVQETFLKAWNALPKWKPEKPFIHWIKRIAVTTGLEDCRKRKHSPLNTALDFAEASNLISDEKDAEARDALDEAQVLLSELPPEDQMLLTLIHLNGMTMNEIAGHFSWSRANAKIKAYRARKKLNKVLTKHGYSSVEA